MRLIFATSIAFFWLIHHTASAATIIVTNPSDSGPGTFREAITNSSSGDTIRFDQALLTVAADTIHLDSAVEVNHTLHIIGLLTPSDTLFLSGDDSTMILDIQTGTANGNYIYLDSLCFVRGGGSAVENYAVHLQNTPTSIIRNCTFRGNSRALYVQTSEITIYGCSFEQNIVAGSGGAMVFFYSDVSLNHCLFKQNSASYKGGAGYFFRCEVDIDNSSFLDNDTEYLNSPGLGGALYFEALVQHVYIDSSSFHMNSAGGFNDDGIGGAIMVDADSIEFYCTHSEFVGNSSEDRGGAIMLQAYPPQSTQVEKNAYIEAEFDACLFQENHSQWYGGAIDAHAEASASYYAEANSWVIVSTNNCVFKGNTCDDAGAAMHLWSVRDMPSFNPYAGDSYVDLQMDSTTVDSNESLTAPIMVWTTDVWGYSTQMNDFPGVAKVQVRNSEFNNNRAGFDGGVFFIDGRFTDAEFERCDFADNFTLSDGGGIYLYYLGFNDTVPSADLTVRDCRFENNTAENGGAIGTNWPSRLELLIERTHFEGNQATGESPQYGTGYGGALSIIAVTHDTEIRESWFHENFAHSSGGALNVRMHPPTTVLTDAHLSIDRVTFSENEADDDGGAIAIEDIMAFKMTRSSIVDNQCGRYGAGTFLFQPRNTRDTIINCSFYRNFGPSDGGGIYADVMSPNWHTAVIGGSILADNAPNDIAASEDVPFTSLGYNVFSSNPDGTINSDIINQSTVDVDLMPLADNGGFAQTRMPALTSVCFNSGNPSDTSQAQNATIKVIRESGAVERPNCYYTVVQETAEDSFYYEAQDSIYFESGSYQYNFYAVDSCDSIVLLDLSIIDTNDTSTSTGQWINGRSAISQIFPNPAGDHITLRCTPHFTYPGSLKIFDAVGRLQQEQSIVARSSSVDLSDLATGTYHVWLESQTDLESFVLIKK